MSELILYGLKSCDTCKKALKALEGGGVSVALVDIRAQADLETLLPSWLDAVGADALVNKRSTTWRGLSDKDKAMTESGDVSSVLIANPTLIKRPVIRAGGTIHVGWTKTVQDALL